VGRIRGFAPLFDRLIGVLSLLSILGIVRGVVYVDDDNVSGPWMGTLEHPYRLIQDGVSSAADGDTVFVFNGFYQENVMVSRTVSMIGENRDSTILDANGEEFALYLGGGSDTSTVSGFTIQNASGIPYGEVYVAARYCTITGNVIRSDFTTYYGIFLLITRGTTVSDNLIESTGIGILSDGSVEPSNVITANTLQDNEIGILLTSGGYNIISDNVIIDNETGIQIGFDENDLVTGNLLEDNKIGMTIVDASDNYIYHNTFLDNSAVTLFGGDNQWEVGYPSGGNYWSDYVGPDEFQGVNQDVPGADGIGDEPYVVPDGDEDRYPFLNPDGWLLRCGDINGDYTVSPADGYHLLGYFASGEPPVYCWVANARGDPPLSPADAYHLFNYFANGEHPACSPCQFVE
jgi:parallel beta-helix repeat protein